MAIEHRTELNQIEITDQGRIQLRFALVLSDGDTIYSREWHRTAIEREASVDAQLALVNTHLAEMGRSQVSAGDVSRVKAVAAAAWAA